MHPRSDTYQLGDWLYRADLKELEREGRRVRLEPRVADLLHFLIASDAGVVSRAQIMQAVWPNVVVGDEVINNAINKLRRALGDDRQNPAYIETLPKTGYRLIAPARPVATPGAAGVDKGVADTAPASSGQRPRANRFLMAAAAAAILLGVLLVVLLWMPRFDSEAPGEVVRPAASGNSVSPDATGTGSDKPVIVVLPFANLSDSEAEAYFADGMTDDLITDLSRIDDLFVISRSSSFAFKGKAGDPREIARRLGARYVIEGSVRRAGGQLRVNARLVDAASGHPVWAERYDGGTRDVFALQDRITARIVGALDTSLAPDASGGALPGEMVSPEIYDLYLRGSESFQRFSREDTFRARGYFEQVVEQAPLFAPAQAMLAWTHVFEYTNGWSSAPEATLQRALEIADRSILLDGDSAVAHFVRGLVFRERGEFDRAMVAARRAIEIEPSYANGRVLVATLLYYAGQPRQGLEMLEIAARLNPLHPSNYPFHKGQALFILERYDEAIAEFESGLEQNPTSERLRVWLAATYAQVDRLDEALWQAGEILNQDPNFSPARLESIFPFRDPRDLARFNRALKRAGFDRLPEP